MNKLEDNIQSLAKKPDIQMSDLLLKVWGSYVSWAILLTRIMMLCVLKALKAFKMVSGSQQHEEEMSCESSCLTRHTVSWFLPLCVQPTALELLSVDGSKRQYI